MVNLEKSGDGSGGGGVKSRKKAAAAADLPHIPHIPSGTKTGAELSISLYSY